MRGTCRVRRLADTFRAIARATHSTTAAPPPTPAEPASGAGLPPASSFRSEFVRTMVERGYVHQATDIAALDAELVAGRVGAAYVGFDATAPSLHVGSLVPLMMMRHFQKCGHTPVLLLGGGTTQIGDPSGKDAARQVLDPHTIRTNTASIATVFSRFVGGEEGEGGNAEGKGNKVVVVNNEEWLGQLQLLPFLREYGQHFTINRMLGFDSVRLRLQRQSPLTLLEFSYMVLQGYDFLHLFRTHNVRLQIGGSDQWGNIVSGVELGRRLHQTALFGLTSPLLTTADGRKMGKSAAGAVWLDPALLSPFDYWQYWRNVADADVVRFLKLFTEVPMEEIAGWEGREGSVLNEAKVLLADNATGLLHGRECLEDIHRTAHSLFAASSGVPSADALPTVAMPRQPDGPGGRGEDASVADMVVQAALAPSRSAARKLMAGGGVRVEGDVVTDPKAGVPWARLDAGVRLSVGKKKHVLVVAKPL